MKFIIKITRMAVGVSKVIVALLTLLMYLPACSQQKASNPANVDTPPDQWNQSVRGNFSSQTKVTLDSTRLKFFFGKYPVLMRYAKDIEGFYRRRQYAFAWFENGQLIEQASNLANRVRNLKLEGLQQQAPYQQALDSLLFAGNPSSRTADTDLELMLTAQYFVFANLAWTGQGAATSLSVNWYLPRKKIDYQQYLDTLIAARPTGVVPGEPVYRHYELLRHFLIKYHQLAAENWAAIWLPRDLKLGDTSAAVRSVKVRLMRLDDFSGDTTNSVFNEELGRAVQLFQERHGLLINGILNAETLKELNVTPQKRIEQLIVNMERSRWLPVQLKGDYLAVNIPEFKLHVYHADSLLWSCNAVVGKTMNRTTVFYGEVKYIVFSPYWNVPPGILRQEILPAIQRNPNYLTTHNMEITGQRNGLPVVRQKPGPDNPLGLVKFLFPNTYNIYLHDTPSKSLFDQSTRAFSHGCIRISEPERLATFLLKDRQDWPVEKIRRYMNAGKENTLTLQHATPVFIAYFTAFVDRAGRLNFRRDIYNMDQKLLGALLVSGH
ncbi:murein L,D-transpeptidase [Mucilaginibacter sp. AK015]|uniref:L,D-transpeptidase family protein n=1 Tax=Mucilaginibacter sp. AK015 TaxID=2723072 RepID=UPI0017F88660|nr:L,D-transpeptidase family protein [Mucilaginibacter sp. AK015]MBB5396849.1 murein L,D-transpeptidase YcbB/YkuD [Mucilaginibacter sp. AK015]